MEEPELRRALETLFFITDHPLAPERVAQLCEIKDLERVRNAIAALKDQLDQSGSALQLMQIAGGWQMATRQENSIWVRKLYHNKMTVRLSQAAIETLCIIAYRQPITRAEVESIRGVEVIGPLDTLSERKLITVVGRRETVGRPILYGTTAEFLRQFGLNSLDDLPKLENVPTTESVPLVKRPEPAQPVLFEEGQAVPPADGTAPAVQNAAGEDPVGTSAGPSDASPEPAVEAEPVPEAAEASPVVDESVPVPQAAPQETEPPSGDPVGEPVTEGEQGGREPETGI